MSIGNCNPEFRKAQEAYRTDNSATCRLFCILLTGTVAMNTAIRIDNALERFMLSRMNRNTILPEDMMKRALLVVLALSVIGISCKKLPDASTAKILEVESSSTLDTAKYHVSNLTDRTLQSWCGGKKDSGIGESITVTFEKEVMLNTFFIKNGFGLSQYYMMNNRIKTLLVSSGEDSEEVSLADTPEVQKITLKNPLKGSTFTLTVSEVYRGSKWNDTCICELGFSSFTIAEPKVYDTPFWSPVGGENCEVIVFHRGNTFTCGAGPGSGGVYDINFWKGTCEKIAGETYRCTVTNEEGVPSFTFAIKGGVPYVNDKPLEEAKE